MNPPPATQRRLEQGRPLVAWVIMQSSGVGYCPIPAMVCVSHETTMKAIKRFRRDDPHHAYGLVKVPMIKIFK